MSVRSGQSITVLFTTRVFATGVGTNADSLPTGTLYVNGVANGAVVTVANVSTGLYTAAVTLPTLAVNDEVEIIIAATVSSVSDKAVIWGDVKDVFAGAIPDVIAGGAGGLFIAGANSATTVNITGSLSGSVGSVTTGVTVTTNNDKTGYSLTQAFPANFSSLGITAGGHITTTDTLTNAPSDSSGVTTLLARLSAARAGYLDNLSAGAVALASGVVVTTNNDKTGYALTSAYDFAKGTVVMAEDYPVKGTTITPAQALYDLVQHLNEMSIVGTALTLLRRDQVTTAKTFTLNDATNPTSLTEAT